MKYLIVSDIHGALPTLEMVLDFYRKEKCDMLCILGDILNYGPRNRIPEGIDAKGIAERLNSMADEIIAVRGNCDAEVDQMLLDFPIMADYALLVDEGKKLFFTHGHIYNENNMPPCRHDVFVYGHTHLWKLCRDNGGQVICNTGSVTFPKEDREPTFALYDDGEMSIRRLDGSVVASLRI